MSSVENSSMSAMKPTPNGALSGNRDEWCLGQFQSRPTSFASMIKIGMMQQDLFLDASWEL
jgi:hypothetical protein